MKLLHWAMTDVGRKRDHNEDSFLADVRLNLYLVADGMGGHAGGGRASEMAVNLIRTAVTEADLSEPVPGAQEQPACSVLRNAARKAGHEIYALAQSSGDLSGMGTTLTVLLFHRARACLAHVGDSRAYLYRDGRIEQISEDHSWINEQLKAGFLSEEEARSSKFKHIITRSVGFERDVNVDTLSVPVLMGDCFLLCSDGLSNYVDEDELARLLATHYYAHLPQLLVELANERGGDDNITVVLVYVANET